MTEITDMRLWRNCIPVLVVLLSACGGSSSGSGEASESVPTAAPPQSTPPQSAPPQSAPTSTNNAGSPAVLLPAPPGFATIRVLGLYSSGAVADYPDIDLRIDHLFNLANAIAEDSNVPVRFELIQTMATAYADDYLITEALEALTFGNDPAFTEVADIRNQLRVDLVTLFRPYANDGLCGYAWVGGYRTDGDFSDPTQADFGYSVVSIDCSDYTLVHELGHNLGLVHSRREDPAGGSLAYGAGHGVDNDFVTIMASPTVFNAIRLPVFSTPQLTCNSQSCGIDAADPIQGADAALALRQVVEQVAAYRN